MQTSDDQANPQKTSNAQSVLCPTTLIVVKINPSQNPITKEFEVDSRAFVNDVPLIGKDGLGNPYHLGQVSSGYNWAKHDMLHHFSKEYNELFPNGWTLVFEILGFRDNTTHLSPIHN